MDDVVTISSGSDNDDSDIEIVGDYTVNRADTKPFIKGDWMAIEAYKVTPVSSTCRFEILPVFPFVRESMMIVGSRVHAEHVNSGYVITGRCLPKLFSIGPLLTFLSTLRRTESIII